MPVYDVDWALQVREQCEPIFNAAQVGFEFQLLEAEEAGSVRALLWEADPTKFAAKYPDSGIIEAYGSGWAGTPCIDYEVTIDEGAHQLVVSAEGWNLPEIRLAASGNGRRDGAHLGDLIARILAVPSPRLA